MPCIFGVFKSTKGYCLKKSDFEKKSDVLCQLGQAITCSYSTKHQTRFCSEGIVQTTKVHNQFILSKSGPNLITLDYLGGPDSIS